MLNGSATCTQAVNPESKPHSADDLALREHAEAIRDLGRRTIDQIVEIGQRLTECKRIIAHGGWQFWLAREFRWDERTALNYMRVFEMSKSETVSDLRMPVGSLYLLAAPSTPKEVCDEIIARSKAGEMMSVAIVKKVITERRSALFRDASRTAESGSELVVESNDHDRDDDDDDRDHDHHHDPDMAAARAKRAESTIINGQKPDEVPATAICALDPRAWNDADGDARRAFLEGIEITDLLKALSEKKRHEIRHRAIGLLKRQFTLKQKGTRRPARTDQIYAALARI
jgi:Protein of unknown function (DUF3102)